MKTKKPVAEKQE